MDTPWFLQHLGLGSDCDAAAIKRAYAERLKQTDQATDIDGFMRLREAYAAASAWSRRAIDGTTAGPAAMPAPPAATDTRPPSSMTTAAINQTTPDPHAPIKVAAAAVQQLEQRLGLRESPEVALKDQLFGLRGEHLQVTAIFEALLVDGLATTRLPQRLALFVAAQDQLGWNDIIHLQQMGGRGQWIRSVQEEEALWKRTADATGCLDLFDRLGGAPALDRTDLTPSHFTRDAALRWPDMQQLLQRYSHYLALRVERSALNAWQQAFNALPPRDRVFAESFSNLPSPAAHRRTAPPRERTAQGGRYLGVIAGVLFALNGISHLFDSHTAASSRPVPASVPAVPRAPAVSPQRMAINAATCQRMERTIHTRGWMPPEDPLARRYLGDAVFGCIKTGDWPGEWFADPQLARLGIHA